VLVEECLLEGHGQIVAPWTDKTEAPAENETGSLPIPVGGAPRTVAEHEIGEPAEVIGQLLPAPRIG